MSLYYYPLLICGLCLLTACQSNSPSEPSIESSSSHTYDRESTDFAYVGEFTSGLEGPAVDKAGNLYFVNMGGNGSIGKITPAGEASLFIKALPEGSVGNGIRFTQEGHMLIADYPQHNVLQVDMSDMSIAVKAHNPNMNQPNDLAINSQNVVFCSDPNWKESTGNLWRVDPDGTSTLLESDMGTTNGIELNPAENRLYVNQSIQRNVWVYDLSPEGEISNKRLLIEFPDFGMDGMRCDVQGNLYITRHGKGTIAIVST